MEIRFPWRTVVATDGVVSKTRTVYEICRHESLEILAKVARRVAPESRAALGPHNKRGFGFAMTQLLGIGAPTTRSPAGIQAWMIVEGSNQTKTNVDGAFYV